jgi:hypothetical protein
MIQRDFLLKEIEKFGTILLAIKQAIFGGSGNSAITLEKQTETAKEMLLNELNFDLDKFFSLNIEDANEYICTFEGFSVENIEMLADSISKIGFNEKALQLYELCNLKSKTFSLEREMKINTIKSVL